MYVNIIYHCQVCRNLPLVPVLSFMTEVCHHTILFQDLVEYFPTVFV